MPIRFHVWIILVCVLALISGCGPKVEPPEVDEGPFTPASISIRENGALMELRDEKLVFIDSAGTEWVAPRGTLTDGASIPRLALPITDGRLNLGVWQGIYLCEFRNYGGPREIILTIIS